MCRTECREVEFPNRVYAVFKNTVAIYRICTDLIFVEFHSKMVYAIGYSLADHNPRHKADELFCHLRLLPTHRRLAFAIFRVVLWKKQSSVSVYHCAPHVFQQTR